MMCCQSVWLFLEFVVVVVLAQATTKPNVDITPIPMDNLNPRITEFRRIDENNDNSLTFTEFLLGDRPYIEAQSRNFHNLDANSDGKVSREEFESYYREQDEAQRRLRSDGFFRQLRLNARRSGKGPIIVDLTATNTTKIPPPFASPFLNTAFGEP